MQNGICTYRWTALSASRDVRNVGPANFSTSTSEFLTPVSPHSLDLPAPVSPFQGGPDLYHLHPAGTKALPPCLSPLAYLSFQLWSQKYVPDIYISSGIFTACISNPFLAVSKSWMSEFTLHSNLLSQNLPQFHLVQPTHRIRNYESANFSKLNWFIFVTELYFATNLWV